MDKMWDTVYPCSSKVLLYLTFIKEGGGGGGIRTHGRLSPTSVFKTGAFNHSATPPIDSEYWVSLMLSRGCLKIFWLTKDLNTKLLDTLITFLA